jgi:hypothetical protein
MGLPYYTQFIQTTLISEHFQSIQSNLDFGRVMTIIIYYDAIIIILYDIKAFFYPCVSAFQILSEFINIVSEFNRGNNSQCCIQGDMLSKTKNFKFTHILQSESGTRLTFSDKIFYIFYIPRRIQFGGIQLQRIQEFYDIKLLNRFGKKLQLTDAGLVRRILRESGIIEVGNSIHTIRRGESLLHIAGLDDYWEHKDRLDFVLKNLPPEGAAILLIHEPDFADISAATGRFDLQLSGHSHGGQVILPFFGPLVLPLYARKYPLGIYRVGQMFQYTNRGIGTIPPAIRFNCRPEITLLTLKSERV